MTSIQLTVYPTIAQSGAAAKQFIDSYPDAFKEMFRMTDYTSGSGFLATELYSLMLPLVIIGLGVTWGAGATAEEEERGTADILFTLPVSRNQIIIGKIIAALVAMTILGSITLINIEIGKGLADLTVSSVNTLYATISCVLLGFFFAGISLILGSVSGKKGIALGGSTGLAIVAFLFFSLAPLVDTFDYLTPINPFQWAIGENQLAEGLDAIGMIKLGIASVALYCGALFFLNRRDIRA